MCCRFSKQLRAESEKMLSKLFLKVLLGPCIFKGHMYRQIATIHMSTVFYVQYPYVYTVFMLNTVKNIVCSYMSQELKQRTIQHQMINSNKNNQVSYVKNNKQLQNDVYASAFDSGMLSTFSCSQYILYFEQVIHNIAKKL